MTAMRLVSPDRIPGRDGRQHLTVLLVRNAETSTLDETAGSEQVQLFDEASILLRKHGVAGRIHDELVKGQVEWIISLKVALAGSFLHLDDETVQTLELTCRNPLGEKLSGKAEQRRTDLVNLPHLLDGQAANERASVSNRDDESGTFQSTDRLPDWTSARPQLQRQLVLVDPLARGEPPVEDQTFDFTLYGGSKGRCAKDSQFF